MSQVSDSTRPLSPSDRGETFSVLTFGIANTEPLDMPSDAFEAWARAIELTSPAVAAEWREKRARAARGEMVSVPPTDIAGADPLDVPADVFEAWVASFESDSPAVAAAWRQTRARVAEAQTLREGNGTDADDANGVDAERTDEPNAPTDAAQQAQSSADDEPTASPVEPYDFNRCTITMGIQLLPLAEGGDPKERQAIIGVRNYDDPPILRMGRWEDLATGFRFISQELLDQLRADLPARERARQEREAQARAEEQTRQERAAQLRAETAARQAKRAAATKKKAQPPQTDTPPPTAPGGVTGTPNALPQAIALPPYHVAPNPRAETPAPAPMVAAQQALF
jgi:hypothetical protein